MTSNLETPPDAEDNSGDSTLDTPKDISEASPGEIAKDSTFEVHYTDVGQADAAVVLCDGEAMLIDGGNAADSNLIFALPVLSRIFVNPAYSFSFLFLPRIPGG